MEIQVQHGKEQKRIGDMSDLTHADDILRTLIGSPGFKEKRNITDLIEDAKYIGLVRNSNNKSLPFFLGTDCLYYEAFLSNRLFQVRAKPSKDFSPQDYDTGQVHPNTVWIIFNSKSCRFFEIEISPVPTMRIWMIPSFDYRGFGYFQTGGKLVDIHHFEKGQFEFPSNHIIDSLWSILEEIEGQDDLVMFKEEVSRLRLMFIDQIVNKKYNKADPPDIELPSWRGWNRQIIRRAWAHAKLLVDPLCQIRND
jgi:hypothetical protein